MYEKWTPQNCEKLMCDCVTSSVCKTIKRSQLAPPKVNISPKQEHITVKSQFFATFCGI